MPAHIEASPPTITLIAQRHGSERGDSFVSKRMSLCRNSDAWWSRIAVERQTKALRDGGYLISSPSSGGGMGNLDGGGPR